MLESSSVTVRELVLALLERSPDETVQLTYQQHLVNVPGHLASWGLFVQAEGAEESQTIWTANAPDYVRSFGMETVLDRPRSLYGAVTVRELVSRLLDEDPAAFLTITGNFPLFLRVGRQVAGGRIVLQEACLWED